VDADYLNNLIRITGVVVALVASFLAAPGATRQMWTTIRGQSIVQAKRARYLLGKPPPRVVHLGAAHLASSASAIALATIVLPMNADAPLPDRVAQLERHIGRLKAMHDENEEAIAKEATKRQEAIQSVTDKIGREASAIGEQISAMERTALLVDARAVPVLGVGIVLTSRPDLIAKSATLSGLAIAVALTFLTWAWAHFFASSPVGASGQPDA
jgi:hypothetical protein